MKNISELQARVHRTAIEKGWHESDELDAQGNPTARQKLAWLALVTDELDEAECEDDALYFMPDGKPEGVLIEIVDALIRLLDMAGACGWDIAWHGDEADSSEYEIHTERTSLVGMIRAGDCRQEAYAALLFTAILQKLERERLDASGDKKPPTVEELIELKDAYNRTRSHRHGGKLA